MTTCLRNTFLLVIILVSQPLFPVEIEQAVLNVILNQEERGEFFLSITEDGDILFPIEDLYSLGLVNLPEKAIVFKDSISLKSLYPYLKYEINEDEASLYILAAPELFEKHVLDFTMKKPSDMITGGANSFVLNYAIGFGGGTSPDSLFFNIPLETALSTGDILFLSSYSYNKTETDSRFRRYMSSMIVDDRVRLVRYTFGDFYGYSGELGGSGNFCGINATRAFSINPYFVKFPDLPLSGIIQTTSSIEVYINGALVREEILPPGQFSLVNVPVTAGAGNAMIVVRDAFGREQIIQNPYYYSQLLLRPGLHEFSYSLGFKREDFGTENFKYSDPSLIALHRYGFTKWLTGGAHTEIDRDTFNAGLDTILILGLAGDLSLAGSLSSERGKFGSAFSLGYAYSSKNFHGRLSVRQISDSYANLSLPSSSEKSNWQLGGGLGFYQRDLGSLSINASYMKMHSGDVYKNMFLVYTRKLFNNILLLFRAQRSEAEEIRNEFFLGASTFIGNNLSSSVDYKTDGEVSNLSTRFQKDPPSISGFGYSLEIDSQATGQGGAEVDGAVSAQYRGLHGEYSGGIRKIGEEDYYDAGVSGSIAMIDRSVFMSRPINNSFALVKASGLSGVGVERNGDKIAITNKKGKAIVPDLVNNYGNEISIRPLDLPINYNLNEMKRYVAPPYRGGSVVSFNINKVQGFTGRIFFYDNGKKVPAEFAWIGLDVNGELFESVVGMRGEFYLENIPPGTYQGQIFLEEKTRKFELIVPDSEEMIVDLGDIVCEGE
ncbi:MAG: fimbria/pilus outer membrane usher protein [Spirochaetota bacterium]